MLAITVQAEREAVENGRPWPASSAAEAALREHFSGEEGTKAIEQQVCILFLLGPDGILTSPELCS